jgi:FkbM family methyltransferase
MLDDFVKRAGRRLGVEISRSRPYATRRLNRMREAAIATVVDVGANSGQYGRELRGGGFSGAIVSLEPLSDAFAALTAQAAGDPSWHCLNIAAGEADATTELYVTSNSASSSLLPLLEEHRRGAPTVSIVGRRTVRVTPLDALDVELEGPMLLKLDVQGYEQHVLSGAQKLLSQTALVECELSLARLYEGQASFAEMIARLDALNFRLMDIDPFFYDLDDGRVLTLDGMFERVNQ